MTERYPATDETIIRTVEDVPRTYGPGGFGIGIIPAGESGRQVDQGPIVPGPWGFLYGRAGVIDNFGGTAAELKRRHVIESVSHGDLLEIDGTPWRVSVVRDRTGRPTGRIDLESDRR